MRRPTAVWVGLRILRGQAGTGRYLRGAVLGIALGLVPLVLVMEVSTGMIEGITARILAVSVAHLQVALGAGGDAAALREAARTAERVPGVRLAMAERQATVLLASPHGSAGVSLRCVDPEAFARDEDLRRYLTLEQGSLAFPRPRVVLLSSALARTLGVGPGAEVTALISASGTFSGLPRVVRLSVGGVYSTGYQELDRIVAYASLDDGLLPARGSRALLGVKVADPFGELSGIEGWLAGALGPQARVSGWRDLERARLASFASTRRLLVLIMALIAAVAAANVASAVLALALERRADLALLAAVGARPATLRSAFLAAGLVVGLAGTTLGLAAGLLLAVNVNEVIALLERIVNLGAAGLALVRSPAASSSGITLLPAAYYLQQIPIRIRAAEVAAAGIGTLMVATLAAWIPAARAARLAPLEVLRRS